MYECGAQSNNRMSLDLLNNLHLCVVGNARNITGLNVVGVKYKCNNNKSAAFSSSFALLLLSFTVIALLYLATSTNRNTRQVQFFTCFPQHALSQAYTYTYSHKAYAIYFNCFWRIKVNCKNKYLRSQFRRFVEFAQLPFFPISKQ